MRSAAHHDLSDAESAPPGLQIGDIYYTLFRHKWKIAICTLIGLVAAVALYRLKTPLFVSQAKLLVLYVVDPKNFGPGSGEFKTPDAMGTGIIDSEKEILASFDLARDVAKAIGAARILGVTNEAVSVEAAAAQIQDGLKVNNPNRGNVILVEFQHPNAEMTQTVLHQLVDSYFKKHAEIHRANGILDDYNSKRADELRGKIADTETELRTLKTSANVVSIEDTLRAHLDLTSSIRANLSSARAELAERSAALYRMTNRVANTESTNGPATNVVIASTETNTVVPAVNSPRLEEYRRLLGQLEYFTRREQELSVQFTASYPLVREIQKNIDEKQREKARMELEDPSLARATLGTPGTPSTGQDPAPLSYTQTSSRVLELNAKIKDLTNQLAEVQQQAARVEDVENKIRALQRQKDVLETQYKLLQERLERARQEQSFGGKLPNISPIQSPTPPGKDFTRLKKRVMMVAVGGLGAGIALAFLIELFLDQSVRRTKDIQRRLRLPVFLSIPRLNKLRSNGALPSSQRKALKGPDTADSGALLPSLQSISATRPHIQRYCDALRDRLIHYFQKNNMTHKPKLVAVTGCGDGSGVSTMAAGLAASLSETGDGNVLLVDTNVTEGAAHPFYRGKLACGLNDVLKEDRRGGAQIQDNLYVAAASDADGGLIKALPKHFSQLVPKLKASDYDYIIFDMPPVTQTSITSKLAGFMDMVLLVVESEKTSQSILTEAADLLHDSRANVATVLNKTRRYVPPWVHREFE